MIRCGREKKQIRWLFTRNQHKYLPTFICKHTNAHTHKHPWWWWYFGCWLNWWHGLNWNFTAHQLNTCDSRAMIIIVRRNIKKNRHGEGKREKWRHSYTQQIKHFAPHICARKCCNWILFQFHISKRKTATKHKNKSKLRMMAGFFLSLLSTDIQFSKAHMNADFNYETKTICNKHMLSPLHFLFCEIMKAY